MSQGRDEAQEVRRRGDAPSTARRSGGPSEEAVAPVQPLDVTGTRTILVGTAVWCVVLVVSLAFYSTLRDNGDLWWLWTCVAGICLGLLGWVYCRRRERRLRASSSVSG